MSETTANHNATVKGADVTTFQLGGVLPRFTDCRSAQEVRDVLRNAQARGAPYLILGGGSNLLISDKGFDGEVVRFLSPAEAISRFGDDVEAAGGVELDTLALFCVEEGLDGMLFATGIPGTVGGGTAGNAGAFGEAIADRIVSLRLFHPIRGPRQVPREAIRFSYRQSSLADSGELIESVRLRLRKNDRERLRDERARILQWRKDRHPDWRNVPCAGSFFRNIEPSSAVGHRQSAGWFLEQAGAKTMRVGGAGVYERHANIIIKLADHCTAQDVYTLSQQMAKAVRQRFRILLQREVRLIGTFDESEDQVNAR